MQELKELQSRQDVMLSELQHRTKPHRRYSLGLRQDPGCQHFTRRVRGVLRQSARGHRSSPGAAETERVSFDELLNAELAAHVGDRSKVAVLVW